MGTLRSAVDLTGNTVNGIVLGQPATIDGIYAWDHPMLPDGEVSADAGEPRPSLADIDTRLGSTEETVDEIVVALLGGES